MNITKPDIKKTFIFMCKQKDMYMTESLIQITFAYGMSLINKLLKMIQMTNKNEQGTHRNGVAKYIFAPL